MALGPGRYDDAAQVIWDATQAEGILLIVVNGNKGSGFSVLAPMLLISDIPDILRGTAEQVEADIKTLKKKGN